MSALSAVLNFVLFRIDIEFLYTMAEKRLRESMYGRSLTQPKDQVFLQIFTYYSEHLTSEDNGEQQFCGKLMVEFLIVTLLILSIELPKVDR